MINKIVLSATLVASAFLCLTPAARADSIAGTDVNGSYAFDGGTPQTFVFTDVTGSPTLTSINLGAGADDSIELIAGVPNGSSTHNELIIDFSSADDFSPSDTIDFTLQLSGQSFNGDFIALVQAIDVQIPTASLIGNTLSFQMTDLDQILGNGGSVAYIFDAEPLSASTPEPATLSMLAIGLAGLLFFKVRRRHA